MPEWDLHRDISDIMNEFAGFRRKNWVERQFAVLHSNSITKGEVKLADNYEERMNARIRAMQISIKGLRAELDLVKGKVDADIMMGRIIAKAQQGLLSSEEPAPPQITSKPTAASHTIGAPMSTHLTEDQLETEVGDGVKDVLKAGDYSAGIKVTSQRLEAKGYSPNVIHEIQGMVAMCCRKNGL